jgi:hypothetical protein
MLLSKLQNSKTPKLQNSKTPKLQNSKTPKLQNSQVESQITQILMGFKQISGI